MTDDRDYLRTRATQEEKLARRADSEAARAVHAHLAGLYRLRLERSRDDA